MNGKPLVWLDNAATTQEPQSAIHRIAHFYAHENQGDEDIASGRSADMSAAAFSSWLRSLPAEPTP